MGMKKKIIAGVIILPFVVLFAMWFVNKQQNERQYAEDLAVRFDETMKASYPMLAITTTALYRRADIWEQNATEAYKNYPREYKEALQYLNGQTFNTYQGAYIIRDIKVYSFFLSSVGFNYLLYGGDLRKKESQAFGKILYAYQNPKDPLEMEYEELIESLHKVKDALSESIAELVKYKASCGEYDDWRNVNPMKYQHIHERYNSKKNWPFTFLNSKK
jgi:hypothetical protein